MKKEEIIQEVMKEIAPNGFIIGGNYEGYKNAISKALEIQKAQFEKFESDLKDKISKAKGQVTDRAWTLSAKEIYEIIETLSQKYFKGNSQGCGKRYISDGALNLERTCGTNQGRSLCPECKAKKEELFNENSQIQSQEKPQVNREDYNKRNNLVVSELPIENLNSKNKSK